MTSSPAQPFCGGARGGSARPLAALLLLLVLLARDLLDDSPASLDAHHRLGAVRGQHDPLQGRGEAAATTVRMTVTSLTLALSLPLIGPPLICTFLGHFSAHARRFRRNATPAPEILNLKIQAALWRPHHTHTRTFTNP